MTASAAALGGEDADSSEGQGEDAAWSEVL
jgi:hypothetical protein